MKKGSNPLPPEGATKPAPPPAPPAPVKFQLPRKFSRKLRRVYIKTAHKDTREILEKACGWPFKQRLRLAIKILSGRR